MLAHRAPHHSETERAAIQRRHSGAREARARNPAPGREDGGIDSGFVLRTPRNDGESYATIFANTAISASGAVTFGAWLASSST